jgi:hypothetical protein
VIILPLVNPDGRAKLEETKVCFLCLSLHPELLLAWHGKQCGRQPELRLGVWRCWKFVRCQICPSDDFVSNDPSHEEFRGAAAMSEPESVFVRDVLIGYSPIAFISVHSVVQPPCPLTRQGRTGCLHPVCRHSEQSSRSSVLEHGHTFAHCGGCEGSHAGLYQPVRGYKSRLT